MIPTSIISYHFGRVRITVEPLSAETPLVIENKLEAPYSSCCDYRLDVGFLDDDLAELIIEAFGLKEEKHHTYDAGKARIVIEGLVDSSAALRECREYLEKIESRSSGLSEEEYLDLLNGAALFDLLLTRDELEEIELSPEERRGLRWLDHTLLEHRKLVTHNIPPYPEKPRDRWWWHLHERMEPEEAARAARARRRRWVTDRIRRTIGEVEHLPRQLESWNDWDNWRKEMERSQWMETMADLDDLDRRYCRREMYPSQEARYLELKAKLEASLPLLDRLSFEKPRLET